MCSVKLLYFSVSFCMESYDFSNKLYVSSFSITNNYLKYFYDFRNIKLYACENQNITFSHPRFILMIHLYIYSIQFMSFLDTILSGS